MHNYGMYLQCAPNNVLRRVVMNYMLYDTCFMLSLILTAILKVVCYYLVCTDTKIEDQRVSSSQSH